MNRLSIAISNESPFSIAVSRSVSNVQECLDFIPGSVFRGSLADLYLKSKGPDEDFKEIFISEKIIFSNLYINGAKPNPLSAYSCKYHGGFLGDSEKHGVVDLILPLIREKEGDIDLSDKIKTCQYIEESEPCGIETKRFKGYYRKILSDDSFESVNIKKRLLYHTAISPISETALENALYSMEVIEREQVFSGDILIDDGSLLNKFNEFIKKIDLLFLGSDKSAGLGMFKIMSYQEVDGFDNNESLKIRISLFNEKLKLNNNKTYFSITLQSDTIVTDKYMRYKSYIDAEDIGIPDAQLIHGIAEKRVVQGWNAMTKLPKEDALAIEKGSVFVFAIDGPIDSILDKLLKLEIYGVGNRRAEGFGRLTVCDPFHFEEGLK